MDPYQILGVGRNSSDDEIKSAYKSLIKKYHPDNYVNNPLSDLAAEKTKEVNEAYDTIMKQRKGDSQGNSYNSGQNGFNGGGNYASIRNLINMGQLDKADGMLNNMNSSQRNAEWHFLKGSVYYKKGWLEEARKFYTIASNMDPYNNEYRMALNMMLSQRGGQFNANPYGGYNMYPRSSDNANCCLNLLCLDTCCECMGGDIISCC